MRKQIVKKGMNEKQNTKNRSGQKNMIHWIFWLIFDFDFLSFLQNHKTSKRFPFDNAGIKSVCQFMTSRVC